MDYTAEELEDLATMRILRARLRACADVKIAECEAMLPARNWLDMNRQIKAIMAADRMVVTLYSPPPRRRSTKRTRRDEPLPSSPAHFSNGEVSVGAARRMTEGSSAVEDTPQPPAVETFLFPCERSETGEVARRSRASSPAKSVTEGANSIVPTDPSLDSAFADIAAEAAREVTGRVDTLTRGFARWAGIWPDGAPYVAKETNWQAHTGTAPFPFTLDENFDANGWIYEEVLNRINAVTHAYGAKTGYRHDHQPYSANDPDYWSLSANIGTETHGPAAGEIPGPPCLPWWIIRKPPP